MPANHLQGAVAKQFQIILTAAIAFLVALAFGARKRWLTSRELAYGGAALIVAAGYFLGRLALIMTSENYSTIALQIGVAVVIIAPFLFSVSMALYFLWKRAKRDEATDSAQAQAAAAAGAAVEARRASGRKRRGPRGRARG